jgi:hypothetical protein
MDVVARACEYRLMPVSILEREIYSETEAARLLRVPPSTLHYWLNGGTKRGKTYAPVIKGRASGRPRW